MYASDLLSYAACTDHLEGTGVVADLEQTFMRLTGFDHALLMSSASVALAAAEDALGFSPGDEIIAPSLTAPETVAHLLHLGCTVVLPDIESETLTLDPGAVEHCITEQTRGIIAADVGGQPHDTEALRAIAACHGLAYLADAAQGFLARRGGRATGAAAHACILSCNAQKQVKAGEMGVLLTNEEGLYHEVVANTQHASRQARETGVINYFPRWNGRANPLAAAVALHTFPTVLEQIERQRRRAARLIVALNETGLVEPIGTNGKVQPTYPSVIARWRDQARPAALLNHLQEAGAPARLRDLPVKALHLLPGLHDQFPGQVRIPAPLVQTDAAVQRCFCLEASW